MKVLEEIPDALERPGGCRIQVAQSDDGRSATLTLTPRPLPGLVLATAASLLLNLLMVFYIGAMLFVAHRSTLFMAQIAPHDLPLTLRRFSAFFVLGWVVLEALGFVALAAMLRPLATRETLHISPDGVSSQQRAFGRSRARFLPRDDVRGFHLERDPNGMTASMLVVQGRDGEFPVAEYVSEADREWLVSVGNALLRRAR